MEDERFAQKEAAEALLTLVVKKKAVREARKTMHAANTQGSPAGKP